MDFRQSLQHCSLNGRGNIPTALAIFETIPERLSLAAVESRALSNLTSSGFPTLSLSDRVDYNDHAQGTSEHGHFAPL